MISIITFGLFHGVNPLHGWPIATLYCHSTANGTMNGNIEVTDTGEFVSISKGDNLSITKDG
ncbi:MAG TPA: hypothetical protein VFY68_17675 [Nitrososphaeraceae archaeon]|nr:hypothetical protein [Nitrososphaeraceae archaeon]